MTSQECASRKKVNTLIEIEIQIQKFWAENDFFQVDAPLSFEESKKKKFYANACYPYMNGKLHLGHAFSYSKLDFTIGFKKLQGYHCLLPMSMHCTGEPIKACADKIAREIEIYGNPPVFPEFINTSAPESEKKDIEIRLANLSKGKKSKLVAKKGKQVHQWNIMKDLGFKDDEISKFAHQDYWISYFPTVLKKDLTKMGCKIDWRRSFITTDKNPYYDSFIRWQFHHLKENNFIKFGKRHTIFSPATGQPCMDHERKSGEGVDVQEYTVLKVRVLESPNERFGEIIGSVKNVFLLCATLRPETMYGQTNVWVGPKMPYGVFETKCRDTLFVCTERCMTNLAHQGHTDIFGQFKMVEKFSGMEIIGSKVNAPLAICKEIYVLPMMTVLDTKGTGIVTSVLSDSPDDYAAFRDLVKKPEYAATFGVKKEMLDYEPIPIIDIKSISNLSAITMYDELKIVSQNDREKLNLAKEKCYQWGFNEGVMLVGEYKGMSVRDAKEKAKRYLVENEMAILYFEPESAVISRSGDLCVVALCDQWYLDYGNESWKNIVKSHLNDMLIAPKECRKNFQATLDWLHEHACSRLFGLGTRLPWDEKYVIESLSDSTIYMALYTISHHLMGGSVDNVAQINDLEIKASHLTVDAWDYIFLSGKYPTKCEISQKNLDILKNEFNYWYSVDLRCSGKDLVQNHLCYYIYNHVAMWPDRKDFWPSGIKVNGHLLLNCEKMSKSTGNFLTLNDAMSKYSADGMRLALADSGDSVDDCNFTETTANAAILKLYNFLDWVKKNKLLLSKITSVDDEMDENDMDYFDKVFYAQMKYLVSQTCVKYESLNFREAVILGFFEFQKIKDRYLDMKEMRKGENGIMDKLLAKFILTQVIILSPICPHICEYIWRMNDKRKVESINIVLWPKSDTITEKEDLYLSETTYFNSVIHDFRIKQKIFTKPIKKKKVTIPNCAVIWITDDFSSWQKSILNIMKDLYDEKRGIESIDNKIISKKIFECNVVSKKSVKAVMSFVQYVKDSLEECRTIDGYIKKMMELNEFKVMEHYKRYILETLDLMDVRILHLPRVNVENDPDSFMNQIYINCSPRVPIIQFMNLNYKMVKFVNPQPCLPYFDVTIPIFADDTYDYVSSRISNLCNGKCIQILFYKNDLNRRRNLYKNSTTELFYQMKKEDVVVFNMEQDYICLKNRDDTLRIGSTAAYSVY